jgi:pimeloyl-ACP methyl ester carboxylesterase
VKGTGATPTWLCLAIFLLASCGNDSDGASPPTKGEGSSASADPSASSPDPSTTGHAYSGTFTVDGSELVLDCAGESETTMVLEVGESAPSQALSGIGDAYQSRMRVCSYKRASTGRDITSDLHGLLKAAKVPGPYLLVGHSAGGLLVQAYAAAYPEETAGVVAINPVAPWRAWSTLAFKKMTPQERKDETDYYVGANGEKLNYRDVSELIAESPVPRDIPLHTLISTIAQCDSPQDICGRTYPAYEQIEKDITQRWSKGRFSQVEAPHDIPTADVQPAIDE